MSEAVITGALRTVTLPMWCYEKNGDSGVEAGSMQSVVLPFYASAADIRALFGVPATALKRMVDDGHVRKLKLGEALQCGALYRVSDVLEFMEFDVQRTNSLERG